MTAVLHDDDRDNESLHDSFSRPSGWEAAWEAAWDQLAPSPEIKKAAGTLVWCELLQQSMGWLLLTQIGVLLGSFGQVMSQGVCLLSWGIFTLEAVLKYGRSWAHNHYFRDVPCAHVPLHEDAGHNSLAFFGLFVLAATLLELSLYVPYIYSCVRFWLHHRKCYQHDEDIDCPDGTTRLIEMLVVSVIIVCVHWISSLATVFAFKAAMGLGVTALTQTRRNSQLKKLHNSLARFSTKRTDYDRLLCLAWWVHMARHRHLSAVVASAKHDDCGLPGHWFRSVDELKFIVEECENRGDYVHLDPSGPLCVSQEMSLRALVSLAKQSDDQISSEILSDDGFLLLIQVVREGKRETCRGLAAAAIAVLATQSTILEEKGVDLSAAVVPLKRLARSDNVEHIEVAYGALLNASLNEKQSSKVISKLLSSDGMAIGEDESGRNFVSSIIKDAHRSHTTRCQELAVGLLSCLVADRQGKPARIAMATNIGTNNSTITGVQLCTALLKHGLTPQIQAAAAGVLAELAYFKDGQVLDSGDYSEDYIEALVNGLQKKELNIAFASAKALCSLAFKNQGNKAKIVEAEGIKHLVNLLRDRARSSQHNRASFSRRDPKQLRFQRRDSSMSLEASKKIDEVDSSSHASNVRKERSLLEEKVKSDAARALRILALNNPQHQQRMVAEGAIPLLVNLLHSSSNPKVHVQAIPALSAISWRNKSHQDLIGECEGGRVFCGLENALAVADEAMAEVILDKVSQFAMSLAEGNESNRQNLLSCDIIRRKLEDCVANKKELDKNDGKVIKIAKKALELLQKEQPT